jgi:hypothetical protein
VFEDRVSRRKFKTKKRSEEEGRGKYNQQVENFYPLLPTVGYNYQVK